MKQKDYNKLVEMCKFLKQENKRNAYEKFEEYVFWKCYNKFFFQKRECELLASEIFQKTK